MFCAEVTDRGLADLSRKIRLSHVHLSHNHIITDSGIAELLANSHQLSSLTLTNCGNLTDNTLSAIFESNSVWGKKRNVASQSLTTLELRANPGLTGSSLSFLAPAVPALKTLDLRDCYEVNLSSAMQELESLKNIQALYLGPSTYPLQSEPFLESMLFHAPNLTTLHLIGLSGMTEAAIAELLMESSSLRELVLTDMSVGTLTIESITNSCSNIQKLSIINSSKLQDKDIRCLLTICICLTHLSVARCPLLTSAGSLSPLTFICIR